MKKLLSVLILLSTTSAFGQNHLIGIKSGISLTNVSADDFFDGDDYRAGFTGGLTYEYEFSKKFHFGVDLLYAQKGFKSDVTFTDAIGSVVKDKESIKFNYNYLSLPVKGGFSMGNRLAAFLNLGLVPSLLADAKTITPTIGTVEEETYNISDRVTRFDFGGLVEIGGNYQLNDKLAMLASFAYQQSFTTITNKDYFNNSKARHFGMTLSIGLKYAL
ncbi:MAG: PorT family protein [Chloroflexia bacterium]|nr:PorT family protein [Chloroflexia bacterium]